MLKRILIAVLAVLVVVPAGLYTWTQFQPHTIRTTVEIDAPPDQVWRVLGDLPAYPRWNPFIVSAEGELRVGAELRNELRNHGSTMTFEPTVRVVEPDRELRWLGRFVLPGVVDGEHYFELEPLAGGRTRLVQGETFTGFLVPFAGSVLDVEDGFDAMNAALKERVETMPR